MTSKFTAAARVLVLTILACTALPPAGLESAPAPEPARPTPVRTSPAPASAAKAKVHGFALTGRVSRLDRARLTFAVRDSAGKETPLSWTAATKVSGGDLKLGEIVTLRYLDKDAKHIATTIRVNAPATPTASAPVPPATSASPAAPASPRPSSARG